LPSVQITLCDIFGGGAGGERGGDQGVDPRGIRLEKTWRSTRKKK